MSQDSVLLDYVIVPNSVYYTRDPLNPSTVTLTIGVSNSTGSPIDIRGFQVLIPVSADPNDQNALTTSASSIQPVSLQPTTWSFQRVGDGLFRAVPIPPVTGVKAGESITFQLAGLAVNQAHGTAQVIITQYEKDGTTLTKPLQVEKIRSTLNIDSFAGYPVNIASGDP